MLYHNKQYIFKHSKSNFKIHPTIFATLAHVCVQIKADAVVLKMCAWKNAMPPTWNRNRKWETAHTGRQIWQQFQHQWPWAKSLGQSQQKVKMAWNSMAVFTMPIQRNLQKALRNYGWTIQSKYFRQNKWKLVYSRGWHIIKRKKAMILANTKKVT